MYTLIVDLADEEDQHEFEDQLFDALNQSGLIETVEVNRIHIGFLPTKSDIFSEDEQ